MCAPCKIILDAGAAAAARGEDPIPAMAEAGAAVVDRLSSALQNEWSRLDAWAVRQHMNKAVWKTHYVNRLFRLLEQEAGIRLDYKEDA